MVSRIAPTIAKLQKTIGYKFNDTRYLWEAVQAPGAILRSGEISGAGTVRHSTGFVRFPDGNRRLAIVGDTVLKLALVEDWYKGDEVRERVSRIVSMAGSNANLDKIGREHGIDACIQSNPGQPDFVPPLLMATTVEAIFGAIYLDSGIKSVTKVMQKLGIMPTLVRRTKASKGGRFQEALAREKEVERGAATG